VQVDLVRSRRKLKTEKSIKDLLVGKVVIMGRREIRDSGGRVTRSWGGGSQKGREF